MAGTPRISRADIEAEKEMIRLKQAEMKASLGLQNALKQEGAVRASNARMMGNAAPQVKKLGDAMDDLGDHADDAAESIDELGRAQKGSISSFQKIEKAAGHVQGAIEGAQAAYKLLIAANYDLIHAANMAMRSVQRETLKGATQAGEYVQKLTTRFKVLREASTTVATGFIVDWQEAVADMDKLMEAMGVNLADAAEGTEQTLAGIQRRVYAMRERTGESFDDQLRNIDYAITHLGLSATAYLDQVEEISKVPQVIQSDLKMAGDEILRYKDVLKTGHIVRAVNDMAKALDMENISVRKLAGSYSLLIEQSIKYGRTQKQSIDYAEKITKGLYGVGNEEDAFQFQNYNAGLEYLNTLKGMGLGGKNDQAAQDELYRQFLDDMGVTDETAKDDQKALARKKVQNLKDVAAEGDINAGVVTDFAPTEARMKAKLTASQKYSGLIDRQGGLGIAGVETFMKEVLGIQSVNHHDAKELRDQYEASGGDMDALAKSFADYGKKVGAQGVMTPDEIAAQEKIAQDRKMAEAPDVIARNYMGPDSLIVEALKDSAASLTSIDGAVGYLAAMGGYTAATSYQQATKNQKQAVDTEKLQQKVQAGTATPAEQQQYAQQLTAIRAQKQEVKDVRFGGKVGPDFQDPLTRLMQRAITVSDEDKKAQAASDEAKRTGTVGPDYEDPLLRLYKRITRTDDQQRVIDQDAGKTPDVVPADQKVPGHRAGLSRVPFDDYLARLHEGEMVVPKERASLLRDADFQVPKMPTPQQVLAAPPRTTTTQAQANAPGSISMEAKVQGSKLLFVIDDAAEAIFELLGNNRPSSPTR